MRIDLSVVALRTVKPGSASQRFRRRFSDHAL
jgi:hypothetical protein